MTTRGDPNYVYGTTWGLAVPPAPVGPPSPPIAVANTFRFLVPGWIIGARYFRDLSDDGIHLAYVHVYNDTNVLSATRFKWKVAGAAGPDSWQNAYFHPRVKIDVALNYELVVIFQRGVVRRDPGAFATFPVTYGNILAPRDDPALFNGQYNTLTPLEPNTRDGGVRYGIDVLFYPRP